VIRDGKLAYEKGYGIANLEYDVPISPGTIFHVASVSKRFTAMALVLLEQEGKLSLEDGIRDQWQTLWLAGWRMDDVITQRQILRMLCRARRASLRQAAAAVLRRAHFPPARDDADAFP
jgi:CubicO group peptidase (beta-lactamase class C family)